MGCGRFVVGVFESVLALDGSVLSAGLDEMDSNLLAHYVHRVADVGGGSLKHDSFWNITVGVFTLFDSARRVSHGEVRTVLSVDGRNR